MAGIRTYQEFVETFIESGLPVPRVPAHVIPRLQGERGWLTTRDVDLDIMAGYDPTMERRSASLYLDTDEPDYFVSGGRGNGYSDFWGFVLRAGGMFCAVQHTIWSSVGNDPDPRKERLECGRSFDLRVFLVLVVLVVLVVVVPVAVAGAAETRTAFRAVFPVLGADERAARRAQPAACHALPPPPGVSGYAESISAGCGIPPG